MKKISLTIFGLACIIAGTVFILNSAAEKAAHFEEDWLKDLGFE